MASRTYIHVTELSNLVNWSVSGLTESNFNYSKKFDLAPIGDFLIKSRETITVKDDVSYKRVTVKINNNGVLLRDTEVGEKIGTKKQYIARAGQFIVSKIDARNGAFGIIPKELDGAIVTNDFPLFKVNNNRISTQFLLLVTTTKQFLKFAQSCSSGTTNRQRMDVDLFLKQKIPLPSIEDQEEIVASYMKLLRDARSLLDQAVNIENRIEKYFREELGIKKQINATNFGKILLMEYSDLERWDGKISSNIKSDYLVEKIGKYISKIATGTTPPTNRKEYFDGDINFYTPAELGNEMYLLKSDRKVSNLAFKDKKARMFPKNTLLFVGIGSTVGKVGIVGNQFAASNQQITGFTVDTNYLLIEYVYYYFLYFREITIKEQTRATLPIVNQEKIINIPIPVPPKDIQTTIIENIQRLKSESLTLRNQSSKMIVNAIQEFEQKIFAPNEN